jgi:hypothetical protein
MFSILTNNQELEKMAALSPYVDDGDGHWMVKLCIGEELWAVHGNGYS